MKKVFVLLFAMATMLTMFSALTADDIQGYMIPEYYSVINHNSGSHDAEEPGIEGMHGFWLRRIYFGYNTKLSDKLSARVRLEMNSPAYEEGTMVPYVKNAHLKYKLGGGASLIAGIIEPPSFDKIEKWWGFRHVEKTAPDFFKLASSRDFGIAIDGKSKGGLVYTLMYGNYGSNKGEDNTGKGVYGRIGYETKTMYVEANGHFANDGSKDYMYLTGFGGLKGKFGKLGVGYHFKQQDNDGDTTDTGVISAFGVFKLGKKSEAFLRYDHFTSENLKDIGGYVPIAAATEAPRFIIAGFNFKVHKMVQITPNVKYVTYDGDLGSDFHINLTAKVAFKTSIGK